MSDSEASSGRYVQQHRGTSDDYSAYYAGMDQSMQQKVALTTAYFPTRGTLADMGCGSGSGSFDLACLYPGLQVVGVDVAQASIAYAAAHYQRANLSYRLGDIAQPIFPPDSLDGVLNSSVFHHLTSFNDFSLAPVHAALAHQAQALRDGGTLIIRDFVIPRGPHEVLLDLPTARPKAPPDGPLIGVHALPSAQLFEHFCATWRSSVNPQGPVPYHALLDTRPGWRRYRVSLRAATEFILRKDYRTDWEAECKEEYTYLSQDGFEAALRSLGLRVVISQELHNPWIVENRFLGQFFLYDLHEQPLPFPPTNYLIVGEKVRRHEGVSFCMALSSLDDNLPQKTPPSPPPFLQRSLHEHVQTGQVLELVERPHPVVDLVPWMRARGQILVFGRKGFPRPLIAAAAQQPGDLASPNLDGAEAAGYLTEPVSAMSAHPVFDLAAAQAVLRRRSDLQAQWVADCQPGLAYFTSPGGLNERVRSYLLELALPPGDLDQDGLPEQAGDAPNHTPFASAGTVRPIVARQLLRAAQVGGLLDARLELNTYHLFARLGESCGPWIGTAVLLREQPPLPTPLSVEELFAHCAQPVPASYRPPSAAPPGNFLRLLRAHIVEKTPQGQPLRHADLDLALPAKLSSNTVSVLPVLRTPQGDFVGLELRDLPAVQAQRGQGRLLTCPAWRLPRTVRGLEPAEAWLCQQLLVMFRLRALRTFRLGGKYYPAAGATPEVVYPLAVEVDVKSAQHSTLSFVSLDALIAQRPQLEDGHLLIAASRLWHALRPASAP